MDYRNAVASLQTDDVKKAELAKISKEEFLKMIAGSKGGDMKLDREVRKAERFYEGGLTLIKQLAKVAVEVNILSVSKTNDSMVLNLNVTAKNISTGTGGAFANHVVLVARRGGPNTDDSAMITGLIKDAYEDMTQEFIPQVIKEMSTIDVGGQKLVSFELVFKGFEGRDSRVIRRALERSQNDKFRYIDVDTTLSKAIPPMNIVFVRYSDKPSKLADMIMSILDDQRINAEEPIVAPGLTDLVFAAQPKD